MADKDLKEYMFKEIQSIEDFIKRMGVYSFILKVSTIMLIVLILLLKKEKEHLFITFIPLLVFWYLDAHSLRMERLYRKLYSWVISNRLQTTEHLLSMNAYRFKDEVPSIFGTMFSKTLGGFYGSIWFIVTVYTFIFLS